MTAHDETKRAETRRAPPGQAMLELLILLPVLLLLFLATAEIAKLFAISGKTEVASRYLALRNFRDGVFEPAGRDFQDPLNPPAASESADELFFQGTLGDADDLDEDVGYREFTPGEAGIFNYEPPPMDSKFWSIISAYFDPDDNIFPIRGHRVTFHYDLPFFPYKEMDEAREWGTEEGDDPLGPYPLHTAKGDFVVLTDTFSGNTTAFLTLIAATTYLYAIPPGVISGAIAFVIWLLFAA